MNTAFNLRRIPLKYTQTRRYLLKFSPLARLTLLIIFSSSCTAQQGHIFSCCCWEWHIVVGSCHQWWRWRIMCGGGGWCMYSLFAVLLDPRIVHSLVLLSCVKARDRGWGNKWHAECTRATMCRYIGGWKEGCYSRAGEAASGKERARVIILLWVALVSQCECDDDFRTIKYSHPSEGGDDDGWWWC